MSDQDETKAKPKKKSAVDRWGKIAFLVIIVGVFVILYVRNLSVTLEDWGQDWDQALAQAKAKDTLVIAVFTRKYQSDVEKRFLKEVVGHRKVLKPLAALGYARVQLNTTTHADLAEKFGVTKTPAIVVTNADGELMNIRRGAMNNLDLMRVATLRDLKIEMAGWGYDWDAALARAKKEKARIIGIFTSLRAGKSERQFIEKTVLNRLVTGDIERFKYVAVQLNLVQHRALAEKFGVAKPPVLIITDSEGELIDKTAPGWMSLKNVLDFVVRRNKPASVPG